MTVTAEPKAFATLAPTLSPSACTPCQLSSTLRPAARDPPTEVPCGRVPPSACEDLPTSSWWSLVAQVILTCFLAQPPYDFTHPDPGVYFPSAWTVLVLCPCPRALHALCFASSYFSFTKTSRIH